MMVMDRIMRRVWRFRAEDSANVTVEFLMLVPILVWGFVSTLQFFDAYRAEMISNKAALTIADMYSRETGYIDGTYLNGTRDLLKYLTLAEDSPDYRVTLFYWRENRSKYWVRWSRNRGSQVNLTHDTLNDMASQLPLLEDGERAILLETWTDYTPQYGNGLGYMVGTGLDPIEFKTHIVTSPRFSTTICWNNVPDDPTQARC